MTPRYNACVGRDVNLDVGQWLDFTPREL